MDIRKLIEEINAITEDELVDEFIPSEIDPLATETDNELVLDDNSIADTLDAKTKIAKALEDVKAAVDYFKDITAEELDLVQDASINAAIETLDNNIADIEHILGGEQYPIEEPEDDMVDSEEALEDNTDNETEDETELNFDDEAQLDLFGDDEQE